MKKFLAMAWVIALLAVLGVTLTTTAASAHTPTANATCTTLNVSLTSYSNRDSNEVSVLINGATIVDHKAFGESYSKSFAFDDPSVANTWKVIVRTDADPNGSKGWSKNLTGTTTPCADTSDKKIVVCHATASDSNPYTRIEVSKASFYEGHRVHEGDIYPAGSFEKGNKTYSWDAQGDQNLLKYEDCTEPPTLVKPDLEFSTTEAVCTDGKPSIPEGTLQLADDPKFGWLIDGQGKSAGTTKLAPGVHTIEAILNSGNYSFGDNPHSWTFTVPQPKAAEDCIEPPTIVEPRLILTEHPPVCFAGEPQGGTATIVIAESPKYTWLINGESAAPNTLTLQPGTYTIEAVLAEGNYSFGENQHTWTITVLPKLTAEDCAQPEPKVIYSEWVYDEAGCGDTELVGTRQKFIFEAYLDVNGEYVFPNSPTKVETEHTTKAIDPEDVLYCPTTLNTPDFFCDSGEPGWEVEDSPQVSYDIDDLGVLATVEYGYFIEEVPAGWLQQTDDTYLYYWPEGLLNSCPEPTPTPTPTEPTPTPSDTPTPVDNPKPPVKPTAITPLAHTGSEGVGRMAGAAAILLALGTAGIAIRRRRA